MQCFMTFFLLLLKFFVTCASSISLLCLYPVPVVFEQKYGNLPINVFTFGGAKRSGSDRECKYFPIGMNVREPLWR